MGGGERFQAIAANNPKRSFSIRFSVQRVKLFARSVGKRLHQPCRHGLECANCSTAYVVQSSHRDTISRQLHKDIRKQARKDKTQWPKDRLAESEATLDPRQKWKWIKRVRSDYKPRPVSTRDSQGSLPASHSSPNLCRIPARLTLDSTPYSITPQ